MREEDPIILRHPGWVIVGTWLGVPGIVLGSLYLLLVLIQADRYDFASVLSISFLIGFPLYMCYHGAKILPYLHRRIRISELGIDIEGPLHLHHPWSSIGTVTFYATASVLDVYDRDGHRLFAVADTMKNYSVLTEALEKYVGVKV